MFKCKSFLLKCSKFCCVPLQLKSLGELCGLVSEKGPTSEDLNRTVDLLAGLGDERPETGEFFSGPASPDRGRQHVDCDLWPRRVDAVYVVVCRLSFHVD